MFLKEILQRRCNVKKFDTEYRIIPKIVKVLEGEHAGLLGEVWYANKEIAEIETPEGWYFAEPLKNLKVIETQKRRFVI